MIKKIRRTSLHIVYIWRYLNYMQTVRDPLRVAISGALCGLSLGSVLRSASASFRLVLKVFIKMENITKEKKKEKKGEKKRKKGQTSRLSAMSQSAGSVAFASSLKYELYVRHKLICFCICF